MLYFSGHGTRIKMVKEYYVLDYSKQKRYSAVRVSDIESDIKRKSEKSNLTNCLFIIDACNQGYDVNNEKHRLDYKPIVVGKNFKTGVEKYSINYINNSVRIKTFVEISSSLSDQKYEEGRGKNGPFITSFVNAIITESKIEKNFQIGKFTKD